MITSKMCKFSIPAGVHGYLRPKKQHSPALGRAGSGPEMCNTTSLPSSCQQLVSVFWWARVLNGYGWVALFLKGKGRYGFFFFWMTSPSSSMTPAVSVAASRDWPHESAHTISYGYVLQNDCDSHGCRTHARTNGGLIKISSLSTKRPKAAFKAWKYILFLSWTLFKTINKSELSWL